jgi:DNA-binding protein H-NS
MTKTYSQIVKQIKALEAEAEKARRKEIEGVVSRIREAIEVYNLSAEDLGFGGGTRNGGAARKSGGKRRGGAAKAAKAAPVVKYSDGQGGTWGGRGKRPQWLRDALASGKQLSDFAVK